MTSNNIIAVTAAGAAGGAKLIVVGVCLAIGFSIGNYLVGTSRNHFDKWFYARMEKKSPEPKEE